MDSWIQFEGLNALGNLVPPPFPVGSFILPVYSITVAASECGLHCVCGAEKESVQATLSIVQLIIEQYLWYEPFG